MEKNIDVQAVLSSFGMLQGKWKLPILLSLKMHGKQRFGELQESVKGIGSKMLSKELKTLEEQGLISRDIIDSSPIVVYYRISIYGETLDSVFKALSDWGIKYVPTDDKTDAAIPHSHIIDI